MASKIVFIVFPNTKTATRSCELVNTKKCVVAMPRISSQRADTMRPTTTFPIWLSLLTAVLVSLSVRARALRSLNALTYKRNHYDNVRKCIMKSEVNDNPLYDFDSTFNKIITTQFLRDLLLTLQCSLAPSKRCIALVASSCFMKHIKSAKYMYLHYSFIHVQGYESRSCHYTLIERLKQGHPS